MIHAERMTARMDGDFVVFMIGMRINRPWMIHKIIPVFAAMPKMCTPPAEAAFRCVCDPVKEFSYERS